MSQREDILKYIREHGSITPLEAEYELGVMRLAARIMELEREGHKFVHMSIKFQTRHGKTGHYMSYSLEAE